MRLYYTIFKHFIVKAAAYVNSRGKKSEGDKHIAVTACAILSEVGVFAFDFYYCIILRFHTSSLTVANGKAEEKKKACYNNVYELEFP